MKPKKLDCLEGVRALACIGVVLCHLKGAFFPNSGLAALLSKTPIHYLFSGNTAVRIMFILSGFVLSYKYFRTGDTQTLEKDAVKRYIRLALPMAAVTFIVYFMMRMNLFYNNEAAMLTGSQTFLGAFNQFEPQLKTAFLDGFWNTLFNGASGYVGPSWTMTYEMLGSYLIFAIIAILKNKKARYILYALYLLIFPAYYTYFILGMLICDLYTQEEWINRFLKEHSVITIGLHIAAWYYISVVSNLDAYRWKNMVFYVASTAMFLTLFNNPLLDRIWGNKAAVTVAKHGFSIYLLHWPIIESFSCAYLLSLTALGYSHRWIVLSDVILSMVVVYVISVLFTRFVVQPSNKLSDTVSTWILKGFKKNASV